MQQNKREMKGDVNSLTVITNDFDVKIKIYTAKPKI